MMCSGCHYIKSITHPYSACLYLCAIHNLSHEYVFKNYFLFFFYFWNLPRHVAVLVDDPVQSHPFVVATEFQLIAVDRMVCEPLALTEFSMTLCHLIAPIHVQSTNTIFMKFDFVNGLSVRFRFQNIHNFVCVHFCFVFGCSGAFF